MRSRPKAGMREVRRTHRYACAGAYIVKHCDVLIALWDGQPARGLGGTGQLVDWMISRAIPAEFSDHAPGDESVSIDGTGRCGPHRPRDPGCRLSRRLTAKEILDLGHPSDAHPRCPKNREVLEHHLSEYEGVGHLVGRIPQVQFPCSSPVICQEMTVGEDRLNPNLRRIDLEGLCRKVDSPPPVIRRKGVVVRRKPSTPARVVGPASVGST